MVDHPDLEETAGACGAHLERAGIVARGVLEEVHEHLADHRLVDLDRRQVRIEIDLDGAASERAARVVDGGPAELLDGHMHQQRAQGAGLDPRRLEQVRDEPYETFGLGFQIGDHRVVHVRVDIRRPQHGCDRGDRGQGRAEVV